jgi:hypothetical protein
MGDESLGMDVEIWKDMYIYIYMYVRMCVCVYVCMYEFLTC